MLPPLHPTVLWGCAAIAGHIIHGHTHTYTYEQFRVSSLPKHRCFWTKSMQTPYTVERPSV